MQMVEQGASARAEELDGLIRTFYEVICFEEGGAPDWERMKTVFSVHARITRITPDGIDYLSVSDFRNMAEELIEIGAYTSLHEFELERSVHFYGDVAHVASAYETRIAPQATDYIARGVNSLQLIREQGSWRVLSLCWDDQAHAGLDTIKAVRGAQHVQN